MDLPSKLSLVIASPDQLRKVDWCCLFRRIRCSAMFFAREVVVSLYNFFHDWPMVKCNWRKKVLLKDNALLCK